MVAIQSQFFLCFLNITNKRSTNSLSFSPLVLILLYDKFSPPFEWNSTLFTENKRKWNGTEIRTTLMRPKGRGLSHARAYVTQPHRDHNVRPCKKGPAGMQILSKDNHFSGIHTALPLFRVRWILHGNRSSGAPVFSARETTETHVKY